MDVDREPNNVRTLSHSNVSIFIDKELLQHVYHTTRGVGLGLGIPSPFGTIEVAEEDSAIYDETEYIPYSPAPHRHPSHSHYAFSSSSSPKYESHSSELQTPSPTHTDPNPLYVQPSPHLMAVSPHYAPPSPLDLLARCLRQSFAAWRAPLDIPMRDYWNEEGAYYWS
jgi:hypothetical protein